MDIPDDPSGTERSNTDQSAELSGSASVGAPPAGRWPGNPFAAVDAESVIPIPTDMMRKNNLLVLQVKGNSMIGDYVLDGDHVILQERHTAKDGDLVVAKVSNRETTLKRYRRSEDRIELESVNPSHVVKVFDEEDVVIQGVVVGILRKYGS
jgi:repressor LexA